MEHEPRETKTTGERESPIEQDSTTQNKAESTKTCWFVHKTENDEKSNENIQHRYIVGDIARIYRSNLHLASTCILIILVTMFLTGCCSVGLHIDKYGARVGKEKIESYEDENGSVYLYMKFTGIGFFWYPIFGR